VIFLVLALAFYMFGSIYWAAVWLVAGMMVSVIANRNPPNDGDDDET
jgi:hypothetical protein